MAERRESSSHAAVGISVQSIVDAALDVIRETGLSGLTMRSLAQRLGVRAPTLYHHVRSKDELLQLVARHAFGSFETEREAYDDVRTLDDWIAITTAGTLELRSFYARHPGLAGLIQATATPGRDQGDGSRAALTRAQIDALVRLGLPEAQARETFEATARWTMGAVAAEGATGADDALFARGLDLFMTGVRTQLASRAG
ncbi:TetR/AcrR family transcriptional regulator [Luteipulveratus mongoliensis]|uniref:TetR family transcriptional regulator n=1 Tax=Luteipulveratus mongoliensis TaxID=571913 RepID=A0A0K1JFG1_9MICO|nr:TetR/AcrR family transcriptional regulator [Luteipulveratus mongoliensis]AKU15318.1 TetR family transcriptional regulator [Luteipulveratus mongoliensis]